MKYLLTATCFLFLTFGFAQTLTPLNANISFSANTNNQPSMSTAETTACGVDTNGYALFKATGLQALSVNNATSAGELSQYFNAPQAITISGVSFYGYKIDATNGITMNVTVAIYAAGLDSIPTGLPLASTTLAIDTTFAPGTLDALRKHAIFATAITTSNPYVVVISNNTATPMGLIFNSWTAQDGDQEWLSSVKIGTSWLRSYNINVGGASFDSDCLFEPHTNYTLTSNYTISDSCFINGNTVSFTNTSSPILAHRMYNQAAAIGTVNVSYTWNFGDASPLLNAINTSHTYSTPGVYSITLSDTNYGWTTNCADSKTVITGLSVMPTWTSTQTGLNSSFTNTTTTNPNNNYSWDFGDGNTSTQTSPNHTYAAAGNYTVCLTVTNGCGPNVMCNTITVGCPIPAPNFTSAIVGIGPDVNFTNTTTLVTGQTYLWDFGDGNTSTQASPNHTFPTAGVYVVCLTVTNTCGTGTNCNPVTVCSTPTASFTSAGTPPDFTFTNTSATFGSNVSYAWDFGDGNISTLINPSHTYLANGTYTVTLLIIDSCGTNTSTQTIVVSGVGLDELNSNLVKIFPNPALDLLNIQSTQTIAAVELIDITGRTIYTSNTVTSNQQIDVSNFVKGQYLLTVLFEDGQKQKTMIVVQH